MSPLMALVLGIVQGVTEFLPISSDGHLALVYAAFGGRPDLAFEVFLHFATLLAMIVYFGRDIVDIGRGLLSKGETRADAGHEVVVILIATAVSGIIALALKDRVEALGADLTMVGAFFLVTSGALAAAELIGPRVPRETTTGLPWWKAALIGVAQGLAALPAVSRSGTTIAGGMLSGLDRERATRFSFLLGIPLIAAASALDAVDIVAGKVVLPGVLPSAIGFVAAAAAGYGAIAGLLALVKRHTLWPFTVYTAVLGVATIAWSLLT